MIEVLLLGALLLQDSKPPEFVRFEVARERIGHRVVVDAELRNPSTAELAGVKLTAIYYEGDREVRRSKPLTLPKIAAGQTAAFKVEADQVPNFSRCEIYLESGASTRLYHVSDAATLPSLKAPDRASMVLVSQKQTPLTLVVRNAGGVPAEEPTAELTFRTAAGTVAYQVRVRLEKNVAASSEESFELVVPGAPASASVEAAVACQASDELALPDPAGGLREVVLRQCRAVRLTDGSARVSGILENGTGVLARKIAVNFRLGKLEAPYELPGTLKPGASRPFLFYVAGCAPFDSVSFDLSFEGGGSAEPEAGPPAPSSRRTASRRVESGGAKLPPPPAKPVEAAVAAELRPPSVGIRGLLVSEGSLAKNGKYTGDIYLMRMIFLDGRGKAWQPEATVQFVLYDGPTEVRKSQRVVTKASWQVDAAQVNGKGLEFDTLALDRKTGELWVGLHWTDKPFAKPRADIAVEIPGVGRYAFKDVAGEWTAAPRYPDSK
ncbi:MAG TPA: hypothetical protein VEN81_14175 [Planctomycetota bacterium]|nr:hypothetical protein [Planctomycetota bacterium]